MAVVRNPETGTLESRIGRATGTLPQRRETQQLRHLPERNEPDPLSLAALGRSFWRAPGEVARGAADALRFGGAVAKEIGRLPVKPFGIVSEEVPAAILGRRPRSNALSRYAFRGTEPRTRERNIESAMGAVEAGLYLPEILVPGSGTGLKRIGQFAGIEALGGGALSGLEESKDRTATRGDIARQAVTGSAIAGSVAAGIPLVGRAVAPVVGRMLSRRIPTPTPSSVRRGVQETAEELLPSGLRRPSLRQAVPTPTPTQGVRAGARAAGEVAGEVADDIIDILPPSRRAGLTVAEQFEGLPSRQSGTATSKLVTRFKESPEIPDEVMRGISGSYRQVTNKQAVDAAVQRITREGEQARLASVLDRTIDLADEVDTAEALELLSRANQRQQYDLAARIVEATTVKATRAGRAVQALSIYGRLTPEGAVSAAQRLVNQAAERAGKVSGQLTPEAVEAITKQSKKVQDLLDGGKEGTEEFIEQAASLQTLIAAQVPPSRGEVISAVQIMAQLLNPKTFKRNIIGNFGFNVLENVSDVGAAAVSRVVSPLTRRRSNVLPSLAAQGRGFVSGARRGFRDVSMDIETAQMPTKFDLPTRRPIFSRFDPKTQTMKPVPVLGQMEKAMGYSLRVPDRAAYQATYEKVVDDWVRLGYKADDPAVMELAHLEGLRRTFQDDSAAARALTKLKKLLNGKRNFGIGDFIIKYPRTPGNLFSRGLDYSPLGFVRGVLDLAKATVGSPGTLRKAFNRQQFTKNAEEAFQRIALQRRGVEGIARGAVGTGALIGTGAVLHKLGVITGSSVGRSYKEEQFRRDQGFGEYRLNIDALRRFALSDFDPDQAAARDGDRTISYDWFQPASMGIVIGADIDANEGGRTGLIGTFVDSAGAASQSLVEQPLFTGVRSVIRGLSSGEGVNLVGAARALAKDMPSSFMPTFVNQIRQLMDASDIETYDENLLQEALNRALRKVPEPLRGGVELPPRYTQLGEPREYGTDSAFRQGEAGAGERLFNVFLNPAFVQRANLDPNVRLVNELVAESGETAAIPRTPDRTFRWQNQSFKLDRFQLTEMAQFMGEESNRALNELRRDPTFNRATDEEKLKAVKKEYDRIAEEAKIVPYLDHLGFETEGLNRAKAVSGLTSLKKRNKNFTKLDKEEQAELVGKGLRLRRK